MWRRQIEVAEGECIEKFFETLEAPVEVSIVTKSGQSAQFVYYRLVGVDFPWVDIEVNRTA